MSGKSPAGTGARLASDAPAFWGIALGCLVGLAFFAVGVRGLATDSPAPLAIGLMIAGFLEVVLCWFARFRLRAAWAFALSLNGTGFVVFLFGAPKLRDAFDTSLPLALLPCVVLGFITALLALSSDDY